MVLAAFYDVYDILLKIYRLGCICWSNDGLVLGWIGKGECATYVTLPFEDDIYMRMASFA